MGRGYDNDVFQGCLVKFAELVVQIFVHSNWQNVLSFLLDCVLTFIHCTINYCSFINLYLICIAQLGGSTIKSK